VWIGQTVISCGSVGRLTKLITIHIYITYTHTNTKYVSYGNTMGYTTIHNTNPRTITETNPKFPWWIKKLYE